MFISPLALSASTANPVYCQVHSLRKDAYLKTEIFDLHVSDLQPVHSVQETRFDVRKYNYGEVAFNLCVRTADNNLISTNTETKNTDLKLIAKPCEPTAGFEIQQPVTTNRVVRFENKAVNGELICSF
jgi:hypothetical protein